MWQQPEERKIPYILRVNPRYARNNFDFLNINYIATHLDVVF